MCASNFNSTFLFLFLSVSIFLSSGTSNAFSQKILLFDVYRWGGAKRTCFYEKDKIVFGVHGGKKMLERTITLIKDTSIVLEGIWELPLRQIDRIRIDRSNFVTRGLSRFFVDVGAGYMILDAFNNTINSDAPVIKKGIVISGISLIAVGLGIRKIGIRKYRMGPRRTLKIVDVTF